MSEAFLAQLPWICETCTLGWADDEVAQQYLTYLLKRVNIILPRRKWHIGTFKEFYPRGQKLLGLNVNQGSEVCIRFRDPAQKRVFLPFHEVLCTTLHELAHCKVRRHDRTFWSLYYDLVRECEALETVFIERGVQLYPQYIGTTFTFNTIGTKSYTDVKNTDVNNNLYNDTSNIIDYECCNAAWKQPIEGKWKELSSAGHTGNVHVLEETTDRSVNSNKDQSSFTIISKNKERKKCNDTNSSNSNKKGKRAAIKVFTGRGHKLGGQSAEVNKKVTMPSEETRRLLAIKAIESRQSRMTQLEMSAQATDEGGIVQRSTEEDTTLFSGQEHIPDDVNVQNTTNSKVLGGWVCPRCTFINQARDVTCVMCTDEVEDDSYEDATYSSDNNHTNVYIDANKNFLEQQQVLWECEQCTFNNQTTNTVCAMCNTKRKENVNSSNQRTTLCNSKRVYEVIDCDAISDADELDEEETTT